MHSLKKMKGPWVEILCDINPDIYDLSVSLVHLSNGFFQGNETCSA